MTVTKTQLASFNAKLDTGLAKITTNRRTCENARKQFTKDINLGVPYAKAARGVLKTASLTIKLDRTKKYNDAVKAADASVRQQANAKARSIKNSVPRATITITRKRSKNAPRPRRSKSSLSRVRARWIFGIIALVVGISLALFTTPIVFHNFGSNILFGFVVSLLHAVCLVFGLPLIAWTIIDKVRPDTTKLKSHAGTNALKPAKS